MIRTTLEVMPIMGASPNRKEITADPRCGLMPALGSVTSRVPRSTPGDFALRQPNEKNGCLLLPSPPLEKHGRAVSRLQEAPRVEEFRREMASEEGKTKSKLRSPVAEFAHAWLKDKLKWVRVRSRGLMKVAAEAIWVSLVYNLQRYFALSRCRS